MGLTTIRNSSGDADYPKITRDREGGIGLRLLISESFTSSGNVVPFYFQPTIGGSDINGQYERTLRAPRTINPDRLARANRAPRLSPAGAKRVMADKARTIELHHLKDNPHDKEIIVVYLPKEKMLIEVDAYTPLAVGDPPPAGQPASAVNLYENIERLKLDVDRGAPLHGRIVRVEDLKKTIGK